MDASKAAWGALGVCLLLVAGCGSSPEDELYKSFKCAKVATLLEREKDGDMAMERAIPYMKLMEAEGGSPARLAIEMSERFQDDVPLYRLTVGGQMGLLSDIYKSSECQALYQPVEGVTKAGGINLAGCKLAPGLTSAEARDIRCSTVDPLVVPEMGASEDAPTAGSDLAAIEAEAAASSNTAAVATASAESDSPEVEAASSAGTMPQRPTLSPSFDCAVAGSPVEHMICTSDRLADLDNRMARQYGRMTRDFGVIPKLVASQRDWISQRNACVDAKCVEEAYDDRLGVLANVRMYRSGDIEGL